MWVRIPPAPPNLPSWSLREPLAGVALAALGLLGLPARAGGPWLRRTAAVVTLAGAALSGTAVGLAGTARLGPHGMVIPALHDAANDRPIRYAPVCGHAAGIPVCLNPSYRSILPLVTAALAPVLGEVVGLPGAPARVTQVSEGYSSGEGESGQPVTISGRPPVLGVPVDGLGVLPGAFGGTNAQFTDEMRLLSVHAFAGVGNGAGTPAQQAVQAALLQGAGLPFAVQPHVLSMVGLPSWARPAAHGSGGGPGTGAAGHGKPGGSWPGPATGPVYAAAGRLAALPPAARRAWLAAHLAALRAGNLRLAQLP